VTRRGWTSSVCAILGVAVLLPTMVSAQTRPDSSAPGTRRPWVTLRLYEAIDREPESNAAYAGAQVDMVRRLVRPRVSVTGAVRSRLRWQGSGRPAGTDAHGGTLHLEARLTPRLRATVDQQVLYAPRPQDEWTATGGLMTGLALSTQAGLTRDVTRRTRWTMGYRREAIRFSGGSRTASAQVMTVGVDRTMTRRLTLRVQMQQGWSANDAGAMATRLRTQAGDVQVRWQTSNTPGTTVTLRLAPTHSATTQRLDSQVILDRTSIVYTGGVRVDRRLSDRRAFGLSYERTLTALEGYDDPIVTDAVGGHLDWGTVGRSIARLSVFYARGRPGLQPVDGRTQTFTVASSAGWRLTPRLSLLAEISRHTFTVTGPRASAIERTTFRAGMVWDAWR